MVLSWLKIIEENSLLLVASIFSLVGFLLIALLIASKTVCILLNAYTKKKVNITKNSLYFPLIGVSFIVALSLVANNAFIYAISILIIATLITELEFLEKLIALIWDRKDYWDWQKEALAVKVMQPTASELPKEKKQLEGIDKKLEKTEKEPTSTQPTGANQWLLFYHCEKVYRLIFGSQLGLLQYMATLGTQGLPKYQIGEIYKKNPLSNSYPLENYIGFLENYQLVQLNALTHSYSITSVGRFFLKYLEDNNIPPVRPN